MLITQGTLSITFFISGTAFCVALVMMSFHPMLRFLFLGFPSFICSTSWGDLSYTLSSFYLFVIYSYLWEISSTFSLIELFLSVFVGMSHTKWSIFGNFSVKKRNFICFILILLTSKNMLLLSEGFLILIAHNSHFMDVFVFLSFWWTFCMLSFPYGVFLCSCTFMPDCFALCLSH